MQSSSRRIVCVCKTKQKPKQKSQSGDGGELSNGEGTQLFGSDNRHGEKLYPLGRVGFLAATLIFLEFVSFCFNAIYSAAYINIGLCLGENTKFHLKSDQLRAGLMWQAFLKAPAQLGSLRKVWERQFL